MTVWRVFQRIKALGIEVYVLNDMSEEEISSLLFPERAKAGDGYLIPDFKWEEFQMCKHQSSIRLCWRRYCKRAAKQNLTAYSWKSFIILYNAYRKPKIEACDPNDKIRNKLKDFNFLLSCCPCGGINYEVIKIQKEEWLKSLKLEEDKILDEDKEYPKGYNRAKLSHIFMDTFLNPCFNLVFDECEKGEITWVK